MEKLNGNSFLSIDFKIREDFRTIDFELINKMLKGEGVPVYVVRQAIDNNSIETLKQNFYAAINKTSGGNRNDDVKVLQIGANQFRKNGKEFMKECDETRPMVNSIVSDLNRDILKDFMFEDSLREFFLKRNVHFGPSFFNGSYCNLFTIRLWEDGDTGHNDNGWNLSLKAHEDLSQLKLAKKDDFEIHKVEHVLACNICIDNDDTNLLLWNMSPDENIKQSLNLHETGYPYPIEMLEGIDYIELSTKPGDVYFINANYLHAVEKSQNNSRITLGRFIGYISEDRIVYWT